MYDISRCAGVVGEQQGTRRYVVRLHEIYAVCMCWWHITCMVGTQWRDVHLMRNELSDIMRRLCNHSCTPQFAVDLGRRRDRDVASSSDDNHPSALTLHSKRERRARFLLGIVRAVRICVFWVQNLDRPKNDRQKCLLGINNQFFILGKKVPIVYDHLHSVLHFLSNYYKLM